MELPFIKRGVFLLFSLLFIIHITKYLTEQDKTYNGMKIKI